MRSLLICLSLIACGGHSHSGYASYQACFDEHKTHESLPTQESIVVCCLDHVIMDAHGPVCGATAAECETYLGTHLASTSATSTERTAACAEYITQKGM